MAPVHVIFRLVELETFSWSSFKELWKLPEGSPAFEQRTVHERPPLKRPEKCIEKNGIFCLLLVLHRISMSITIEQLTGISDAFFRTMSSSLLGIQSIFCAKNASSKSMFFSTSRGLSLENTFLAP